MAYKIILTHAAKVDALRCAGGEAEVEQRARAEIDAMMQDGMESVSDLIFHTLEGEPDFICSPSKDGDLIVDACETEERQIESGPLVGKKVRFPKPFSV